MESVSGYPTTIGILNALLPGGLWMAFWFFCVNWKILWPPLARGGWVPVLLLVFLSAMVWSRLAPGPCNVWGVVILPNYWWQLLGVAALVLCAFFSGWLQATVGYNPGMFDPKNG